MVNIFWVVISGAIVSIVTTLIAQLIILHKEKVRWARERKAKLDDQHVLILKEQRESLRNAYSNCIYILSLSPASAI